MDPRRALAILSVLLTVPACGSTSVDPASCEPPNRLVDGRCRRTCSAPSACLLGEACEGGICVATGLPLALDLSVTPNVVSAGEAVTIEYVTAHADRVEIQSIIGGDAVDVLLQSEDAEGSLTLPDVSETLTIVLIARNGQGEDRKQIDIEVIEPGLRIVSFNARPAVVSPGGEVTLSWQVVGADRVEIYANDQSPPLIPDAPLRGMQRVRPPITTAYELRAFDGAIMVTESAEVFVGDAPPPLVTDIELLATDHPLPGDTAVLSWQTVGATEVTIGAFDNTLRTIEEPQRVSEGSVLVPVLLGPVRWQVTARRDDLDSPTLVTDALGPEPGVEIEALNVSPPELPPDQPPVDLTVTWSMSGEPSTLTLFGPQGEATDQLANNNDNNGRASHTFQDVPVDVPATMLFEATGPRGHTIGRQTTAWPLVTEQLENGERAVAQRIDGFAVQGSLDDVTGAPNDARDWYVRTVAQRQTLRVRLETDLTCAALLSMEVYEGASLLPYPVTSLPAEPDGRALYAPGLDAGDVFVLVETLTDLPCDYTLFVEPYEPLCGNGMIDFAEVCDDGNSTPRDGCSPACLIESLDLYDFVSEPFAGALLTAPSPVALWTVDGGNDPASDEGVAIVPLPFEFPFYGRRHRAVLVSANGFIRLSESEDPDLSDRDDVIALFGQDLQFDPSDPEAGVFVNDGAMPGGFVEISFRRMRAASGGADASGAIRLYPSGQIDLVYVGMIPIDFDSVTVGIQGRSGEASHGNPICGGRDCDPLLLGDSQLTFAPPRSSCRFPSSRTPKSVPVPRSGLRRRRGS